MKTHQKQAFTLVELIVVITILAILWTIAFISLQWYSTQARDSTRISDLSSIKTSLELFHLEAGKYPLPTDWVDVTYSWSTVWKQWTFWKSTYDNIERLNKIPTDPLSNSKYTYSTTENRNEFELAWITEWDLLWNIDILNNTNAWETIATAFVTWNYNWAMQKTLTWSDCSVLSLPTIIASDVTTSPKIEDIVTNNRLVYTWYNNLPNSYKLSKFDVSGWFIFSPNKLVSYSDTNECSALYDSESNSARTELITNLQTSYSWTTLENKWLIAQIVNVDTNNTDAIWLLWTTMINNNLWWDVEIVEVVTMSDWTPSTVNPTVMVASDGTLNLSWLPNDINWVVLEWDVTWFINSQTLEWWYGWVWVSKITWTISEPTGSKAKINGKVSGSAE